MGFAIGAVIGALSKAGQAYLNWDAQNSALSSISAAYKKLQPIDIDRLKQLAQDTDLARYGEQFKAQRDIDPTFAALRDQGGSGVLSAILADQSGQSLSDTSLKELADQLGKEGPVTQSFIDKLLSDAKSDLDAGATLPPEFQSELIRSGLENSGQAGFGTLGQGAAGTNLRTLLGSQGLALQRQRQADAQGLIGSAEQLRQRRASILEGLSTLDNNLRGAKVQRAAGASMLGSGAVPALGLTGADAANATISNLNLKNSTIMGQGQIKAMKRLAEGQMYSSMLGSGSSMLTSLLGGMGGGDGGGMGGGGGGGGMGGMLGGMVGGGGGGGGGSQIGSWIGGLLNNNGYNNGITFSSAPAYASYINTPYGPN